MMRRTLWTVWTAAALALAGCASGPLVDNPVLTGAAVPAECEANPMYLPLGPTRESYFKVFDCALSTLNDFGFVIAEQNTFEGRIETQPRIAPGILRPLRPGSPSFADRLLETAQTYRHRATVLINPADNGGYWIKVTVFKELEDLPRPTRSVIGAANFRVDNNVERKYEVVDPTLLESSWIPRGEDIDIEQQLLCRLKQCR
jgi:hypothetical protein